MEHTYPTIIKPNLVRFLRLLNNIPSSHADKWVGDNISDDSIDMNDLCYLYGQIKNIDFDLLDYLSEFVDTNKSHEELADQVIRDNEEWNSPANREKCVQEFIDTISSPGIHYLRHLQDKIYAKCDIADDIETIFTNSSNNNYGHAVAMITLNTYPIEIFTEHVDAIVDCLLYFVSNQTLSDFYSEFGCQDVPKDVLWKTILEVIRNGYYCPEYEPSTHETREYRHLFLDKLQESVVSDKEHPRYNYICSTITTIYLTAYNRALDQRQIDNIYPFAPIVEYANKINLCKSARK